VKISVSVPDEDVEFLDDYAQAHRSASRSAVVQRAIRLLRASELSASYAAAFTEWDDDSDNAAWDSAAADV
jgi:Arc/MetJ-type ribon-helix-helix transcriptional regulator